MQGISSRAANALQNKAGITDKEIQNKEFSDGTGLESYDFGFRMQDPQIGRWWQIDPLADLFSGINPYNYVEDNPTSKYDPDGLSPDGNDGPNYIAGYVKRPDGTVYFDPNVHKQEDLGPNSDLTYLGERLKGTKKDGTVVWFDENGNSTTADPGWENMPTVVVSTQKKPADWYGPGGKINFTVGTSASVLEGLGGIARWGTNLRLYNPTALGRVFYGNQHVKTFSISKTGALLGKVSFFAGVVMDAKGVYTYYKSGKNDPNAVHPGKAGLNTAMGAYGVWINPIASTIYFGIDAFYPGGTQGWANDNDRLTKENQAILGDRFVVMPYGALKQ